MFFGRTAAAIGAANTLFAALFGLIDIADSQADNDRNNGDNNDIGHIFYSLSK